MKASLTAMLLGLVGSVTAQTIVQRMQTTNNDKTLAMVIVGQRAGRPFRHTLQFDVTGLTKPERDSLYQQTIRTLNELDIRNVPGMGLDKPNTDSTRQDGGLVVFHCENCTGKAELEIYGNRFVSTRSFHPRRKPDLHFPLTMQLNPGQYRYVYRQKGRGRLEHPFDVEAGRENVVTIN